MAIVPPNNGRIAIRPYRGLRGIHWPSRNLVGADALIGPRYLIASRNVRGDVVIAPYKRPHGFTFDLALRLPCDEQRSFAFCAVGML